MKKIFLLIFLFAICTLPINGQDAIKLTNPSFEDLPRASKTPRGWYDCGFPGETPPDTQPSSDPNKPIFGNTIQAEDGNTYIALITRDNETWERISQRLKTPMFEGHTYQLTIHLAKADRYISNSRKTNAEANYNEVTKLRIYGGTSYCNKEQLLDESPLIESTKWKAYTFEFQPEQDLEFIIFEAFYKTPILFPYNGNILLDNCSDIIDITDVNTLKTLSGTDLAKKALYNEKMEKVELVEKEIIKESLHTTQEIKDFLAVFYKSKITSISSYHINLLIKINAFNTNIESIGLRQYILSNSSEDVSIIIKILKIFGAQKSADKINQIAQIYTKSQNQETLEPQEYEDFENCEAPFKAILEADNLNQLMDVYIEINQPELSLEMNKYKTKN